MKIEEPESKYYHHLANAIQNVSMKHDEQLTVLTVLTATISQLEEHMANMQKELDYLFQVTPDIPATREWEV